MTQVFNMDCMDAMKEFPDKFFDLCLTDPPYGVGIDYGNYNDTKGNTIDFIKKFMPEILRVSKLTVLTPGVTLMNEYPKPSWTGCIFSSAGVGVGPFGFCCWQPILIYGKDPKLANGLGSHPDSVEYNLGNDKESKFHPVPKPLRLWNKLLSRWTVSGKPTKVIDPFLGSGTGRISADDMGFDFWGYELDKEYFDASVKRFEQYKSQTKLFI